ncbi:hypothetical protein BaRGS_00004834 [Batillaria attramentaria]|uniref:WW domain-binding protein 4 n=1 Tax=Batillaria attramentaria TaxID=370345 RepID=A0ABD0LW25_9CAEN
MLDAKRSICRTQGMGWHELNSLYSTNITALTISHNNVQVILLQKRYILPATELSDICRTASCRADYWKSQPRKFCEFCKCWITDNKPSVEFHERGKRHKENVQKRIDEVRKRSADKAKEQEELDEDMAKMEKAAMEALRRDLARDPSLAEQYGVKLKSSEPKDKPAAASTAPGKEAKTTDKTESAPVKVKEWFEAKSPEGYSYYWNISTNESRWEPPDEYVSLAEQEGQTTTDETSQDSEQVPEADQNEEPEESGPADDPVIEEPPPKMFRIDPVGPRSAYGAWETVRQEHVPDEPEVPEEPVSVEDIPLPGELPETPSTEAEAAPVKKERFKEKTVTSLGPPSGGNVGFKKRKIASGARNMRQRDTDD